MEPDFVGSATEVAITYSAVAVSLADIVSIPLLFILVPLPTVPVPAAFELTFHVTALLEILVPVTAALS